MRSRTVITFSLSAISLSLGTTGGGAGGGEPTRTSRTYLPRATGEVRFENDVTVSHLPYAFVVIDLIKKNNRSVVVRDLLNRATELRIKRPSKKTQLGPTA